MSDETITSGNGAEPKPKPRQSKKKPAPKKSAGKKTTKINVTGEGTQKEARKTKRPAPSARKPAGGNGQYVPEQQPQMMTWAQWRDSVSQNVPHPWAPQHNQVDLSGRPMATDPIRPAPTPAMGGKAAGGGMLAATINSAITRLQEQHDALKMIASKLNQVGHFDGYGKDNEIIVDTKENSFASKMEFMERQLKEHNYILHTISEHISYLFNE